MSDPANPILLYDGVCGLCNRLVQFVLKHDADAHFRLAFLQGSYAARIMQSYGFDPKDLNTIYVVDPASRQLLARSDVLIFVLHRLDGFWRMVSVAISLFPRSLRDWGYGVIARNRYRIFGKYESCPLPEKRYEDRFLDG